MVRARAGRQLFCIPAGSRMLVPGMEGFVNGVSPVCKIFVRAVRGRGGIKLKLAWVIGLRTNELQRYGRMLHLDMQSAKTASDRVNRNVLKLCLRVCRWDRQPGIGLTISRKVTP